MAKPQPDPNVPTRELLVAAAAVEFNAVGYHGTNSNKIARAAGFAPQTFYRHFEDKIDVFLAVYARWQASEREAVTGALGGASAEAAIGHAVLEHHRQWRTFRASLRLLAAAEPRVRAARAASRERQLDALARVAANAGRPRAELAGALLTIERLADAAADGELGDLGLTESDAETLVAAAVRAARGAG